MVTKKSEVMLFPYEQIDPSTKVIMSVACAFVEEYPELVVTVNVVVFDLPSGIAWIKHDNADACNPEAEIGQDFFQARRNPVALLALGHDNLKNEFEYHKRQAKRLKAVVLSTYKEYREKVMATICR